MFNRVASLINRWPWPVLALALVFVGVAGLVGTRVFDALSGGGFVDPAAESVAADNRLAVASRQFPDGGLIALVRADQDVNAAAVREEVEQVAATMRGDPEVDQVLTYYGTHNPGFVSRDGRSTFVLAYFKWTADNDGAASRLKDALASDPRVTLGGTGPVDNALNSTVGADLGRAELIAFPILFLLSLWVFRGVVAALMPLVIGAITILGTFLGLYLIARFASLSIYALNLSTGMGLGLSIDYSLFMISRYREELAGGLPPAEAIRRTVGTAGRTVFFSALTIAAAMASLLVFPLKFLYSMGAAGVLVALLAAAVSLLVLPSILRLLGPRINALAPRRWQQIKPGVSTTGFWYRFSHFVMRRPLPIALGSAALLIALGLPFLSIKFSSIDATALPTSFEARQVHDYLVANFPGGAGSPIYVVTEVGPDRMADVSRYANTLASLPHVQAVDQPVPVGADTMRINLHSNAGTFSSENLDIVKEVRATDPPFGVLVGGSSAYFYDLQGSLRSRLPLAVAIIVISTLVLLFLATGSLILPLKAVLMNFLTLSVAFGVLVIVFQWGLGNSLLDFATPGALEQTQPVLLFAIVFGLSTDYGVFLLTRIKEMHDAGASNREAVAAGLERTGRVVTAAALLLSVAIGAFATSQIVFIKELGVGIVAGILIDATIVRAFLVPSLMALLGEWNWWAPRPLSSLYGLVGTHEQR
jgi:putative drug exporter of the RND superfamily